MKLLNRLERSLGAFAIRHITLYIVFLQSLVYVFALAANARNADRTDHPVDFLSRIVLDGGLVRHGEVWRVITYVMTPPFTNPIFFFFAMYLLFLMGTALENQWGAFRYNIYLLVGWAATVAVAVALPSGQASNADLMLSVFLAFAYLYPDFVLQLFFFFPVKVKWLALGCWIIYLLQFLMGPRWLDRFVVLAAIANFVLFFHAELWQSFLLRKRRMLVQAKPITPDDGAFHRCTICGVSDKSDRKMEFRYCPQCAGTPCYCINHIHTHEHRTHPAGRKTE